MDKATLYLDSDDYRRLKRVAFRRRVAPAVLVREAIATLDLRHFGAIPIKGRPRLIPRDE